MEGLQKFVRSFSKDPKSGGTSPPSSSFSSSSPSSSSYGSAYSISEKVGLTAALSPPAASPAPDQSRLLVTRPPRQMVSLRICSKLCLFFFAAGIVVGFTLKGRLRRWAAKLLKKLKDS